MVIFNRQKNNISKLDTILNKCSKGNRQAQEQLYKMFYSYALNVALRYFNSNEQAREIVNDGFLKIFTYLIGGGKVDNFLPWLRKIIINQALDAFRKNKKNNKIIEYEEHLPEISFDEEVLAGLSAEEIISQLQKLPELYRLVFSLYEIEGYSHKEISVELGITEPLSRKNLSRAKKRLIVLLQKTMSYERG